MHRVRPWGVPSPSDSNPREVAQLDATTEVMGGEHSSIQLSEYVGRVSLRAFGGNKGKVRQRSLILSECTMLDLQCHRIVNLHGAAIQKTGLRKSESPGS